MGPGSYDLRVYRNDSYAWRFRFWDDPQATDPDDLTDAVAAAEVRDRPGGSVVVPLSCSITLPNVVDVVLDGALWGGFPPGGVWDLQITYGDGRVRTMLAGRVVVTPDVTASTPVAP